MLFNSIMTLLRGGAVDPLSVIIQILATLVIVFLALPLHELAHGWVAYKLGDPTAKYEGRLTLNPLASIDPMGAMFLLLFGIGWAKPVPIDSRYFKKYGVALTGLDTTRPFEWSETTVAKILEDEIYLGHTISLRYTTQSYKNKRRIERPETEWLRFEDTHEPLITKELWELVREVRRHKRKAPKKFEEPNLFSGLLYCADCGAPLRLHRTRTQTAHFYNNFKCSTYSNRGKDACSGHYIRESQLKAIVLDDLRRVTQFARQKENLLLRHVARQNSAQAKKEISLLQGELDKLRRREQELTALFKRLYEDNVLGRIPDEQYRILSAEYTQERTLLQEKIPQMAEQQEKLRDSIANAARFVERARQYSTITELTPELLRLFIDKIVIGERSAKYSRCAAQEVSIYYRDVGLLDTAEELDMENLLSDTAASA